MRKGRITGHEVLDKFGQKINIPHGTFPSSEPGSLLRRAVKRSIRNPILSTFFQDRLPRWRFAEFEAALKGVTKNFPPLQAVEELTQDS